MIMLSLQCETLRTSFTLVDLGKLNTRLNLNKLEGVDEVLVLDLGQTVTKGVQTLALRQSQLRSLR